MKQEQETVKPVVCVIAGEDFPAISIDVDGTVTNIKINSMKRMQVLALVYGHDINVGEQVIQAIKGNLQELLIGLSKHEITQLKRLKEEKKIVEGGD